MIKLGRLTDYAIVLLSQMAMEGKGVHAASDLAEKTSLPLPTTAKILKKLTKAGVLNAQRGVTGGYSLAREAAHISIATVVEAMDGPIAITDCTSTRSEDDCCRIKNICPMRTNWHQVNRAIQTALQNVSLAEMLNPHSFRFDETELSSFHATNTQ